MSDPRLNSLRHGHAANGTRSPTYRTWQNMVGRCGNPKAPNYERYGGRGIAVCERWRTFDMFLADMGERPAGTTIDRIDNNGHYEPGNCRWARTRTQVFNRRNNKLEPHEPAQIEWLATLGYHYREIGAHFGIHHSTAYATVRVARRLGTP